jgi:hypothetical protein
MTKPINFSSSNTLTSTRQPWVPNKNNIASRASSSAVVGGMSRPNTNLGHNPNVSPEVMNANAQAFSGPKRRPRPMKHWRRQLNVNGNSGRSATSISVVNRPGGTVFRGYNPVNDCACDASGNNQFITFDNKFLQSPYKSIKPPITIPLASGTHNNKIQNNGSVVIVPGPLGHAIQTGIYNTKTICCTKPNNIIRSAVTLLSKAYYTDSKAYLKSRCKLYSQKQSIQDISGNNYGTPTNPAYPSDSPTGSQVFNTTNCAYPYLNGTSNLCTKTIYKPNNAQFATQGAVDNGTRLAKLKYDTITKNGNSFRSAFGAQSANAGKYHGGYNGNASYFLKSKLQKPITFRRNGQKTVCFQAGKNCGPRQSLGAFWGAIN